MISPVFKLAESLDNIATLFDSFSIAMMDVHDKGECEFPRYKTKNSYLCIPAIIIVAARVSAEREGYLRMITIATFFSAVTATALQMSSSLGKDEVGATLNSFWFASLVFSIASSISSFLGMTWAQSPA